VAAESTRRLVELGLKVRKWSRSARLGSYRDLKAIKVHVHIYWAFFDSGYALVFEWPIAMGCTN